MTRPRTARRPQRGRPPKLEIDPEIQTRIVAYIRAGAFPERAAAAAGIHPSTHYRWQAKGIEERDRRGLAKAARKTWQIYLDYLCALEQAEAQAEIALLAKVNAGDAYSAGARFILERRFPERWKIDPKTQKATAAVPAPKSHLQLVDDRRASRDFDLDDLIRRRAARGSG